MNKQQNIRRTPQDRLKELKGLTELYRNYAAKLKMEGDSIPDKESDKKAMYDFLALEWWRIYEEKLKEYEEFKKRLEEQQKINNKKINNKKINKRTKKYYLSKTTFSFFSSRHLILSHSFQKLFCFLIFLKMFSYWFN